MCEILSSYSVIALDVLLGVVRKGIAWASSFRASVRHFSFFFHQSLCDFDQRLNQHQSRGTPVSRIPRKRNQDSSRSHSLTEPWSMDRSA